MNVLGIVCSGRRMGNSEILAKHVLQECRKKGSEVKLLRLADWNLDECKGCFGCLMKDKECDIKDDLKAFAQTVLYGYDRIIVSAPTYQLFPPGIVKVVIDRIGVFVQQGLQHRPRPRYGAIVGIAGVEGWDYFTIPMLTMFLKVITGFQAEIVDQSLFHHPGPGEVLLSRETLGRVELLAERLMQGRGAAHSDIWPGGIECPICHSNSFIIRQHDGMQIECPFCRMKGTVGKDGSATWDQSLTTNHRLTEKAGRQFVENWILKTREVFEKNFKTIFLQKQIYKDSQINIEWEKP